ncbi:FAD assembly factor SdhE [Legionella impletisoli]|nr:succinate dehydrogenase assembly factor 2 [Legionella impletisoli]
MISPERKAKIKWNCRRGMLELDLILNRFREQTLETLSKEQLSSFERLLELEDPELYFLLMTDEPISDQELKEIVSCIKSSNHA